MVDLDFEYHSIRLLDLLYERSSNDSTYVEVSEFLEAEELPVELDSALAEYLDDRGLVSAAITFGGAGVMITSEGRAFVQEVRAARRDPVQRVRVLRELMLRWLYESEAADEAPQDWSGFSAHPDVHHLGDRFSESEVDRQRSYLCDRGLISGVSFEEAGPAAICPVLTTAGRDCVTDHGGDVAEYSKQQRGSGTTNNITMGDVSGNAVVASSDVVQTVITGLDTTKVMEFAKFVHQIASTLGLPEQEQEDLAAEAEELADAAADPTPEKGRMRRLCGSLLEGVTRAAPSAASNIAIALGNEAVQAITG